MNIRITPEKDPIVFQRLKEIMEYYGIKRETEAMRYCITIAHDQIQEKKKLNKQ